MIDSFRGKYYFLSNFYMAPITFDGITYQNNEAAFQAQKVFGEERLQFANISPNEAKKLGRKVTLRSDWEEVKESLMEEIVRAKFKQNPDLMEKLIDTKDEKLIEGNTWGDRTWGVVNGQGLNLLGKILMKVRDEELSMRYPHDFFYDLHDKDTSFLRESNFPFHCELVSLESLVGDNKDTFLERD